MSFSSEYENIEQGENKFEEDYEARRKASVAWVRYQRHSKLFSKLQATRYRFMATIDKGAAEPFDGIRKVVNEIMAAAHILSREWAREHSNAEPEARKKWFDRVRKFEAVFWEMSDNDEINAKVQVIVRRIEDTCRPVIEGKA